MGGGLAVVTADAAVDVDEVAAHVRIEDLGRNRADCRRGGGGQGGPGRSFFHGYWPANHRLKRYMYILPYIRNFLEILLRRKGLEGKEQK